jgi:hypothetical protein
MAGAGPLVLRFAGRLLPIERTDWDQKRKTKIIARRLFRATGDGSKKNSAFGREPTVLVVGVNNPPAA